MFENLSNRMTGVFRSLSGRGILSESHVQDAMREIRVALLEADVALPVAKEFIEKVKEQAVGEKVLKSVQPAQQVVKIVNDALVETLGPEQVPLNLNAAPPVVILMVGLQGSGKTTTSAKLAKHLQEKHNKKVLLASLDVYRPAAQDQLQTLAGQISSGSLPIVADEKPLAITDRALKMAREEGYDVVFLDTAGRTSIDDEMMEEVRAIAKASNPTEIMLVVDAMTGQDAVHTAENFRDAVNLTGVILTRIDGDARGGAALSMRSVTGCPIKFIGTGEKLDGLEPFYPERIASRILDMGDVVSLVEKAAEVVDEKEAERMAARFQKGQFDLNDLAKQLQQVKKLGGLGGIMGLIPGIGGMKKQMEAAGVDESMLKRQEAILSSMTPQERTHPKLLKASRKKRIADGSGTSVQDVNKLLKQFEQMAKMMKKFSKMGGLGQLSGKVPLDLPPEMGKMPPLPKGKWPF